jgi:hypothetical protein
MLWIVHVPQICFMPSFIWFITPLILYLGENGSNEDPHYVIFPHSPVTVLLSSRSVCRVTYHRRLDVGCKSFALMSDESAWCHQIVALCTVNCTGLIVLFSLIWFRIVKHDGHMTTGTQSLPWHQHTHTLTEAQCNNDCYNCQLDKLLTHMHKPLASVLHKQTSSNRLKPCRVSLWRLQQWRHNKYRKIMRRLCTARQFIL